MKDGLFEAAGRRRRPRARSSLASGASSSSWPRSPRCAAQRARLQRRRGQGQRQRLVRRGLQRQRGAVQPHTRRCCRGSRPTRGCRSVTTDDLTDDDVVGELDLLSRQRPLHRARSGAPASRRPRATTTGWPTTPGTRRGADAARRGSARTCGRSPTGPSGRSAARPRRERAATSCARLYLAHVPARVAVVQARRGDRARGFDRRPRTSSIAESLQLRNAHVYLAAAIWADWARDRRRGPTFRDAGRWSRRWRAGRRGRRGRGAAVAARGPARAAVGPRPAAQRDPLQRRRRWWSLDRNGGRITHLFAMVGRAPVLGERDVQGLPVPGRRLGRRRRDEERRHRAAEHRVHAQPRLRRLRRRGQPGHHRRRAAGRRASSTGTTRTTSTPTEVPGADDAVRRSPCAYGPGAAGTPRTLCRPGRGGSPTTGRPSWPASTGSCCTT